ncbi:MAG: pyridoxal phosphate-dependent aminotransferase, partial [Anaerolineales bacterium]
AKRYGSEAERFLFADGADSILFALPKALGASSCIYPTPTYSGYRRAALHAAIPEICVSLDPEKDFALSDIRFLKTFEVALENAVQISKHAKNNRRNIQGSMVFLGSPNNPAGGMLQLDTVLSLAEAFPMHWFIIDESFLELVGAGHTLIGNKMKNIVVVQSLTKSYAVPGARIGFMHAEPDVCAQVRKELSSWPVSCFAEQIAIHALADESFLKKSVAMLQKETVWFCKALEEAYDNFLEPFAGAKLSFSKMKVFCSGANFLLLDLVTSYQADFISGFLAAKGIAVRRFDSKEGLDKRYIRIAIKKHEQNERFLKAFREALQKFSERNVQL